MTDVALLIGCVAFAVFMTWLLPHGPEDPDGC